MAKAIITRINIRIIGFVTGAFLALFSLTACHPIPEAKDGPPAAYVNVARIPNAVPKVEPLSKYGNPPSYMVSGKRYYVLKSAAGYDKRGIASWYGTKFHDRRTSSGKPYNMFAMTAASKVLPLPTYVQVTDLQNDRQVIVKINDRGPFEKNRIIDLSYVAARKLDMMKTGTALVEVKAINPVLWQAHLDASKQKTPQTKIPHHPLLFLQVAAFVNKQNAAQLEQKLGQFIHQAMRIKTSIINDRPVYRVQVGPLANVEISDQVTQSLSEHGFGEPMTVIE